MSIDNNIEKPDHNRLEHEKIEPIDNSFQLALLHFRYCEMRAGPNVALFDNLS